jgi:hypothetical protein
MPDLFEFQLEILKQEIETINASIRQMDLMTEKVKNWAIVTWTAATGAAISRGELRPFIALTSFIPVVFWMVDLYYRRIQRKFIWRSRQITEFLNDGRLAQSFEAKQVVDFRLFDPIPTGKEGEGYNRFVSFWTIIRFKSLSILYIGMVILSLVATGLKFLL